MAKNYGHIYTKNSTGTIDKFVPVLDSSQINHGNDNVENVLNDTVKSVSVEVIDGEPVLIEQETETIENCGFMIEFGDGEDYWQTITPDEVYPRNVLPSNLSYNTTIEENTLIDIMTINPSSLDWGSDKFVALYFIDNSDGNEIRYVALKNNGNYLYSYYISDWPSTGNSAEFYINSINWSDSYTLNDKKFIVENLDGSNYKISFVWNPVISESYPSAYFTAKTALNFNNYYDNETSYYEDSLSTNQLYNVYNNITIDSLQNGFCFFFMPDYNNNNLAYYVMSSYSGITSEYSGSNGLISATELPQTTNGTKDFYVNAVWNGSSFSQYTQDDIKFTITENSGDYILSMIWEKEPPEPEIIEIPTKILQTTVTKNDDTEVVTTSSISGILQDMNVIPEQKIAKAQLYDVQAHIEVYD